MIRQILVSGASNDTTSRHVVKQLYHYHIKESLASNEIRQADTILGA